MSWRHRGDWSGFGPRRPAQGIRAQTQRGQFGRSWWAGRWLRALEQLVDAGRLSRGRSYARSGQVTKLDVSKQGVDARVQGSMPHPYTVKISFRRLGDAEWGRIFEVMASEAGFGARLLSGEMPPAIEDAFVAAGTTLFPSSGNDLATDCSCPDWSNPCKHLAAVFYLLGEQFDADPFLIFLLRGRSREEIIAALRSLRGVEEEGATDAEEQEPETPLLAGSAASFWASPPGATPALGFAAPSIDALPVKSLSEPPFWREREPFLAEMERLYRAIGDAAREQALG